MARPAKKAGEGVDMRNLTSGSIGRLPSVTKSEEDLDREAPYALMYLARLKCLDLVETLGLDRCRERLRREKTM